MLKEDLEKNIPFSLTKEDFELPEFCPVLGIQLIRGFESGKDSSPSIDRIIPELGYIKDNIIVVSRRANGIKTNSTIEELEKVYFFYKELLAKKLRNQ